MSRPFKALQNFTFILFFIITIILFPLTLLAFNQKVYGQVQGMAGVFDTFTYDETKVYVDNLIGYFRGENKLDVNLYSNQAILHLSDVRFLIQIILLLLYTSTFVLILSSAIFIVKRKTIRLNTIVRSASAISFWLLLICVPMLFLGFESLFFLFHKAAFHNDLWLFQASDTLIMLFPSRFFLLFSGLILLISISTNSLIFLLTSSLKREI